MQKDGKERQQMFLVIEGWKKSGQSQQAYCKEQGIRYHIFHYWYKVYRDEQWAGVPPVSPFVHLQVEKENSIPVATTLPTATDVELMWPDGKRLLFHSPVDACFLRHLLQ